MQKQGAKVKSSNLARISADINIDQVNERIKDEPIDVNQFNKRK